MQTDPLKTSTLNKQTAQKKRLVVIGNGMAGMKTVEELLSAAPDEFDITVFGAEPHGNYNRIMLSPVLAGEKTVDEIMINNRQWYTDNNITLHAGEEKTVVEINRAKRVVVSKDGTEAPYDRLLIATGSNPFIIPFPGHDLTGVIAFRDIKDVNTMMEYAQRGARAVVIGGGLLGLEAANGLRAQGMAVTVLHDMATLLNRQLDEEAAKLLQQALEARGIEFMMQAKTKQILSDDEGQVRGVEFADGSSIDCELFVMAVGVRPNFTLAKESGLHCDRALVVNDHMQTYDPAVYAVGECVQHRNDIFGMVAPLFDQAKVCANHLSEHGVAQYETLPMSTKLKISGINLFSVGDFIGDDDCEYLYFRDLSQAVYKKLVIKNGLLVGAVLYGETLDGGWYQQLLEDKTSIDCARQLLIFGKAYAKDLIDQQTNEDLEPQNSADADMRDCA